jgi:NAD(P)H-nitrite reductase large subunit
VLTLAKGAATGLRLRNLRTCPVGNHCKLGEQDALKIATMLDQTHYGWALPGKFKMVVSGCHLHCPESWVRDIGPIGQKSRRDLAAEGNVGANPWIA